ncbi:MAG: hypothetical protein ACRDL1_01715 [Solirubrobacterales bacterium]
MDESRPHEERGVSDALRVAIERTLASVGDTGVASATDLPAETLARAGELLDEVARRGYDAGTEIARRAGDASLGITARLIGAVIETLRRDPNPEAEDE